MLPPIWCHMMVCTHSGQQLQADQQRERERNRQTSCLVHICIDNYVEIYL